jgi:hypothetical protein
MPEGTLTLEVLSESQVRSGELAVRSLEELLEYSDDVNYASYLTVGALSELSETDMDASPLVPVDFEKMASSNASLATPGASNDYDLGCTDYLLSPTDDKEIDQFEEGFFYS